MIKTLLLLLLCLPATASLAQQADTLTTAELSQISAELAHTHLKNGRTWLLLPTGPSTQVSLDSCAHRVAAYMGYRLVVVPLPPTGDNYRKLQAYNAVVREKLKQRYGPNLDVDYNNMTARCRREPGYRVPAAP